MVSHKRDEEFISRRYSGWNRPSQVQTKKKRPFLKFILFLLFVFSIIYGYIFLLPVLMEKPSVEKTKAGITQVINSYPDYDIGVSLLDIDSGDKVSEGKQSAFTAASTTKVLTAALTMHEVESGRLSLNLEIYGYPISWHLEQMINQSNDDSWKALNYKFGKKKMEQYAKSIGLNSYKYDGNLISANDMTTLLAKLYKNELMSEKHTKKILSYMVNTNDDSFIPAIADTQDIRVYHKYGWYENNIHDAAILVTDKSTWVLSIYTHPKDDGSHSSTSKDIIHKITQVVVNQLHQNQK